MNIMLKWMSLSALLLGYAHSSYAITPLEQVQTDWQNANTVPLLLRSKSAVLNARSRVID